MAGSSISPSLNVKLTPSTSASITSASEKIHQQGGTTAPTSTIYVEGVVVYAGEGVVTATGVFTQTTTDWRIRESTGIVSSTSGTATIAREKWEIISVTPITWTPIVNDSVTWTEIAA